MLRRPNKKHKDEILHVAYFVAIIQPIVIIPQIYQIFTTKSASDLSLIMWVLLLIFNISNLIYSWAFNIKPMIVNNLLFIVVDVIVIYGIFAYG